ncbi:hypothetical protein [Noviherbaspirillum cavernae]|uniref:hypothetical protein n=1 Tax=Noviherbaspirillum cavernae TaxID=2320862 RepID=UPI0011C44FF5|nr:hypothetical protein [Noviherbaspirillum cavernae]
MSNSNIAFAKFPACEEYNDLMKIISMFLAFFTSKIATIHSSFHNNYIFGRMQGNRTLGPGYALVAP